MTKEKSCDNCKHLDDKKGDKYSPCHVCDEGFNMWKAACDGKCVPNECVCSARLPETIEEVKEYERTDILPSDAGKEGRGLPNSDEIYNKCEMLYSEIHAGSQVIKYDYMTGGINLAKWMRTIASELLDGKNEQIANLNKTLHIQDTEISRLTSTKQAE